MKTTLVSTFGFFLLSNNFRVMSTSEMRRGPGWWMDLDGQWKPPQEWPESTPPLPGWTRNADGLWSNESLQSIESAKPQAPQPDDSAPGATVANGEAIDLPAHGTAANDRVGLTYSTDFVASTHNINEVEHAFPHRALTAAIAAAVIAVMLGAGIVLLILL